MPDLEDQHKLVKLCEFSKKQKFELIYKATEDGFATQDFHNKCDQTRYTLVLIRSIENYIIGGYTEQYWSDDTIKMDPYAFIFSLVDMNETSVKMKCKENEYAISCVPTYGPIFGAVSSTVHEVDLMIAGDSNKNEFSSFNFVKAFKIPHGFEYVPEDYFFKTTEIEVYKLI